MDELAMYLEEIFETCKEMRLDIPAQNLDAANRDIDIYTAVLVIFSGLCSIL